MGCTSSNLFFLLVESSNLFLVLLFTSSSACPSNYNLGPTSWAWVHCSRSNWLKSCANGTQLELEFGKDNDPNPNLIYRESEPDFWISTLKSHVPFTSTPTKKGLCLLVSFDREPTEIFGSTCLYFGCVCGPEDFALRNGREEFLTSFIPLPR